MNSIKRRLARHHNNFRGWTTDRKIVVIESDDWGSICMPSSEVYSNLQKDGFRVDLCSYAQFDSLANEEDLDSLFTVLKKIKDFKGNYPVITANTIMTNPDFEKIKDSGFKDYHYELFTNSLKRCPTAKNSFKFWRMGIEDNLFIPQFHGREHLNVKSWMNALNDEKSDYRSAFDYDVCWLGPAHENKTGVSYRATYDTLEYKDLIKQKNEIAEGLKLFRNLFGYPSDSFIAPNFIYHSELHPTLHDGGVRYIQGMKYQKHPILKNTKRNKIRRTQGEKNEKGQYNLVRNCVFEPSQFPEDFDNIGECLKGIRNAFFWRKPAVITAHRLNFIGHIVPENRSKNLKLFQELLMLIKKEWPTVEFMSSSELGKLIEETNASS